MTFHYINLSCHCTLCHCKLNIQDYYESLGNHEKQGLEETWSCLCLVTSHIVFLSSQAQLLKPRLDEKWVCQTLFMWVIFFKIVTLNLGVVNNNQLKSLLLGMCSSAPFPTCQTTLGLWERKVPRVIDLIAECISNSVAVVALSWRVLFFNDWSRYQRYHNPSILHSNHSKGRYMKSFWRSEIFRIWLVLSSCSETQP